VSPASQKVSLSSENISPLSEKISLFSGENKRLVRVKNTLTGRFKEITGKQR
jgi:hypothetical protein